MAFLAPLAMMAGKGALAAGGGALFSHLLKKITGNGSYVTNDTCIVSDCRVPMFGNFDNPLGSIRCVAREWVQTIGATGPQSYLTGQNETFDWYIPELGDLPPSIPDVNDPSLAGDWDNSLYINPGNAALFPLLSKLAPNFQRWRVNGMVFELNSLMPSSTTTPQDLLIGTREPNNPLLAVNQAVRSQMFATPMGEFAMVTQYNPNAGPLETWDEITCVENVTTLRSTENGLHYYDSDPSASPVSVQQIIHAGQSDAPSDRLGAFYCPGRFTVFGRGIPGNNGGAQLAVIPGSTVFDDVPWPHRAAHGDLTKVRTPAAELFVNYDIELMMPQHPAASATSTLYFEVPAGEHEVVIPGVDEPSSLMWDASSEVPVAGENSLRLIVPYPNSVLIRQNVLITTEPYTRYLVTVAFSGVLDVSAEWTAPGLALINARLCDGGTTLASSFDTDVGRPPLIFFTRCTQSASTFTDYRCVFVLEPLSLNDDMTFSLLWDGSLVGPTPTAAVGVFGTITVDLIEGSTCATGVYLPDADNNTLLPIGAELHIGSNHSRASSSSSSSFGSLLKKSRVVRV